MISPADPQEREPRPSSPEEERPASALWQWLAIGVLMACWLAEGSLYAASGP